MVTRSVPVRDPPIGDRPAAVHTGSKGPMGVRFADQWREPAIRSHESVARTRIVEKPSDS
jgi:hypothetical protein